MPDINENTGVVGLSVKFYWSKTYDEALLLVNTEPGAICFVSDDTGNYIIVNGKVFGDGTSGGGGSGGHGDVVSVNGKQGVVVLTLSDFAVATIDGVTKTLADYFTANGSVVSDSFIVTDTDQQGNKSTVVAITKDGILINDHAVATQSWVEDYVRQHSAVTEEIQAQIDAAEQSAKEYTDQKISSVYTIKGSVLNYNALENIENPKSGWVYNVQQARGTIGSTAYVPPGTNYVYVQPEDGSDGYWDALGGNIDLSGYITKIDSAENISSALQTAKQYADGIQNSLSDRISTNASNIANIQSQTQANTATISTHTSQISTNTTNISQNTTNINNIATQLTWQ